MGTIFHKNAEEVLKKSKIFENLGTNCTKFENILKGHVIACSNCYQLLE